MYCKEKNKSTKCELTQAIVVFIMFVEHTRPMIVLWDVEVLGMMALVNSYLLELMFLILLLHLADVIDA
jgi:hypothetical protein